MSAETLKIKICGLTRAEDALLAAELGAWALGFIFYRGSPRCITPQAAREIIDQLPQDVKAVGVFVNASADEIQAVAEQSGIQVVQYHGNESPVQVNACALESIKAFRLEKSGDLTRLAAYRATLGYLVDAAVPGVWGGSGAKANWELAAQARAHGKIILAGGLSAENIACALETAAPDAVDVSSGIEQKPGVKCAEKLIRFFAHARQAEQRKGAPKP